MGERWHVRAVPLPDGSAPRDWWIDGGRLVAGPLDDARALPGAFLAPGLVDAHVHLTFEAKGDSGLERGSEALVAWQRGLHPPAGVLAVRDAGALPFAAPPEARPPGGPRVIASGPFLAPAGTFLPHLYEPTAPHDAPDAARALAAAGSPWVKVIADHPGPDGDWFAAPPCYEPAVLRAIVGAAHAEGARVAAHVSSGFVAEVVDAGVDSIEHGPLLDEPLLRRMAAAGQAWTPTLATITRALEPVLAAPQVPEPAKARIRAVLAGWHETIPLAAALGVPIMAGTDEVPHGAIADEVERLAACGLTPAQALAAATTWPRAFLGLPALEEGAPADVVLYDTDPRADLSVLRRPAAVLYGGRRVAAQA